MVFSSLKEISITYLAALGKYERLNCGDAEKSVYYNEKSGFYLFRNKSNEKAWMVRF